VTVQELVHRLTDHKWGDEVLIHYDGDYIAEVIEVRMCTAREAEQRGKHYLVIKVLT
jgi:hypothetical protein